MHVKFTLQTWLLLTFSVARWIDLLHKWEFKVGFLYQYFIFQKAQKICKASWDMYEVWSKNIGFILSPSKQLSSDIIHLCQHFFQSSKHFWNALLGIINSSCFDFSFISSIVANAFLSSVSSVLRRGKSQWDPSLSNTLVVAWLRFCFWATT